MWLSLVLLLLLVVDTLAVVYEGTLYGLMWPWVRLVVVVVVALVVVVVDAK